MLLKLDNLVCAHISKVSCTSMVLIYPEWIDAFLYVFLYAVIQKKILGCWKWTFNRIEWILFLFMFCTLFWSWMTWVLLLLLFSPHAELFSLCASVVWCLFFQQVLLDNEFTLCTKEYHQCALCLYPLEACSEGQHILCVSCLLSNGR